MIRVLLVEHPPAVRRALRESLRQQADLRIAAEAGSLGQGLPLVQRLRPEVVVLDAEMAGLDLRRAVRVLRECAPDTAVLIVTIEPDCVTRELADVAGVTVIGKMGGPSALLAAVRRSPLGGSPPA